MRRVLALIILIFTSAVTCRAQLTLDRPYYPRVIVPDHIYVKVTIPSITIDTLIMDDRSSLRFSLANHKMVVKRAAIAKRVTWKASGEPGAGKGGLGKNGSNLMLDITFHNVGSLVIDTRGGQGSNGRVGRRNARGGRGGNGGRGGDLYLRHRCEGFVPVFGSGSENSIILRNKGGPGGMGGHGGSQGSASNPMQSGEMGNKGRDGKLTVEEMPIPM